MKETEEKINGIIRRYLQDPDTRLDADVSFAGEGLISSFDLIAAVAEIEEELQVEIPDRALEGFRTLGDLYGYVASCLQQ